MSKAVTFITTALLAITLNFGLITASNAAIKTSGPSKAFQKQAQIAANWLSVIGA
jgi:hypothetical protein